MNPVYHSYTKHIDIQHHYIWDPMQDGSFNIMSVQTRNNVADPLAKFHQQLAPVSSQELCLVSGLIAGECCESDVPE